MTLITEEPRCHVVSAPLVAWGHIRPLTALLARLVHSRPIIVTYFVPKALYPRTAAELMRFFEPEDLHLRDRIRLVAVQSSHSDSDTVDLFAFFEAFADNCVKLANEEPVQCAESGVVFDVVHGPDVCIMDVFAFMALPKLRAASKKPIKAYAFCPWMGTGDWPSIHRWRTELDSGVNIREVNIREASESGQTLEDYTAQKYYRISGEVLHPPGLPPMYDHELYPQQPSAKLGKNGMVQVIFLESHLVCDGVIFDSPDCLESPASIQGLREWMKRGDRDVFGLGPLLSTTKHSYEREKTTSQDAAKIDVFMDNALRTNGPKSLIFISFGTLFWPSDPNKLWTILEILQERRIPFILSYGGMGATVPDDIINKVHSSKSGIITSWAPQQAILAHAATGWFISHVGFGSVIESIVAGVPIIAWPYLAEQPINAMHLTENLDIAYELFEVRTGEHATMPVHRTGTTPLGTIEAVRAEIEEVLDKAFGEDGEKKRANVARLREEVGKAWDTEGSARKDLNRLLDAIGA